MNDNVLEAMVNLLNNQELIKEKVKAMIDLLNEHRVLLREASLLLDDAYQFCMYGGDAASSLDLGKVQQWEQRYQALMLKATL